MIDALIMIPLINSDITESNITRETLYGSYFVNKFYGNMFPLTYLIIDIYQRKYKELVANLKRANCHTNFFVGA